MARRASLVVAFFLANALSTLSKEVDEATLMSKISTAETALQPVTNYVVEVSLADTWMGVEKAKDELTKAVKDNSLEDLQAAWRKLKDKVAISVLQSVWENVDDHKLPDTHPDAGIEALKFMKKKVLAAALKDLDEGVKKIMYSAGVKHTAPLEAAIKEIENDLIQFDTMINSLHKGTTIAADVWEKLKGQSMKDALADVDKEVQEAKVQVQKLSHKKATEITKDTASRALENLKLKLVNKALHQLWTDESILRGRITNFGTDGAALETLKKSIVVEALEVVKAEVESLSRFFEMAQEKSYLTTWLDDGGILERPASDALKDLKTKMINKALDDVRLQVEEVTGDFQAWSKSVGVKKPQKMIAIFNHLHPIQTKLKCLLRVFKADPKTIFHDRMSDTKVMELYEWLMEAAQVMKADPKAEVTRSDKEFGRRLEQRLGLTVSLLI